MRRQALELLTKHPVRVAQRCGLELLREDVHGPWLRDLIAGRGDMTLLAHRGSYKTTCLAFAMAAMLLCYPDKNLIFMRKTDDDVTEVIRSVKMLLSCSVMQALSTMLYTVPVRIVRSDMFSVQTNSFHAMRGAMQLLGLGTGGSLTGKHADIVITDDIVNLKDRTSEAERTRICGIWQELQNIRNPGGRIINTGTPWHPEDAVSRMPNVRRFDCYRTGLLSGAQITALRETMAPSLFAANYELKHLAGEDALFPTALPCGADPALIRDGIAHLDAAYGGGDCTALTLGVIRDGQAYLYGRLFPGHVDRALPEIIAECERLLCGPVHLETNGDKGYLARELRRQGVAVRPYAEHMPKYVKISSWLRKWWPRISFIEGTDQAYIDQILGYSRDAAHDDAPDSAASLLRYLDRSTQPHHLI